MPLFSYRATTNDHQLRSGDVAADGPRQARDLLRSQGMIVLDVKPVSGLSRPESWRPRFGFGRRISAGLFATSIRELATLLGVGIPLLEGLDVLIRQYRGSLAKSLLMLRDRVAGGASLSQAMAGQPEVYDALSISMVEVGERAGNLDSVLAQLAEFKERSAELKDRVVTALLYPVFVLVSATVVSIFLMTVVVPTLLENLVEAGRPLPWPTRVLKAASDLLTLHGFWTAIGVGLLSSGIVLWQRTLRGTRFRHQTLLKIPVIGTMTRKQAIARIALVISVLMRSGIEFLRSLEIAGRAARNLILEEALERAGREIQAGQEIGIALSRTSAFPPVVVQVFAVGQQSGQLEGMLERLALDYDKQVNSSSSRIASVLEPVLIAVLAVVVGFILFATMLPILEAGNVFDGP